MARKKKKGSASSRGRETKNGRYRAVNVYIHRALLERIDSDASDADRSRRAELERLLCKAYKTSTQELDKEIGVKR